MPGPFYRKWAVLISGFLVLLLKFTFKYQGNNKAPEGVTGKYYPEDVVEKTSGLSRSKKPSQEILLNDKKIE